MGVSRRSVLLAGLGLVASGCAQTTRRFSRRPGPMWPTTISPPSGGGRLVETPPRPHLEPTRPGISTGGASESALLAELGALPRTMWTNIAPQTDHINMMDGVTRMTAHHEGWKPVWFTNEDETEHRLKLIQHVHMAVRGWADIGYHFVVDRDGRLWEARPIEYQGAHVKYHNQHNIGVMCLGNFMKQEPSRAQVRRLGQTLKKLVAIYQIPIDRVYTHRELMPTLCPGDNLQPHVNQMRSDGYLS